MGIGLIAGWLAAWVHRKLDDPLAETAITLLSPYAAFLPAEAAGASGILAAVTMGLYVGHHSVKLFSPRLRLRARAVWNTVTFLLNGFLFVLIGLQFKQILAGLAGYSAVTLAEYVAILWGVVVAARLVWIFPAAYVPWLLGLASRRPPWRQVLLEGYVGLRGVISLIAVLTIPTTLASGKPFPFRELLIFLTYMLILTTLVLQGPTLSWVIRALGLAGSEGGNCEEHEAAPERSRRGCGGLTSSAAGPTPPAAPSNGSPTITTTSSRASGDCGARATSATSPTRRRVEFAATSSRRSAASCSTSTTATRSTNEPSTASSPISTSKPSESKASARIQDEARPRRGYDLCLRLARRAA